MNTFMIRKCCCGHVYDTFYRERFGISDLIIIMSPISSDYVGC